MNSFIHESIRLVPHDSLVRPDTNPLYIRTHDSMIIHPAINHV